MCRDFDQHDVKGSIRPKRWVKETASVASCFTAGFLDGQREVMVHDYRRFLARHPNTNQQRTNPRMSFKNKYKNFPTDKRAKFFGSKTIFAWTTDKLHSNNTGRNFLLAGNVAIVLTIGEKPNWKNLLFQAGKSWACFAIGSGAAHAYYKEVD